MLAKPFTRRTLIAAGLVPFGGSLLAAPGVTIVPLAMDDNPTMPRVLDILAPDLEFDWSRQFVPWARLLSLVERGEAIGMNVGYSHARAEKFIFSEPIFVKRVWMFVRKTDTLRYTGFADLQQRRLCVRRDVSYGDEFDAAAQHDFRLMPVNITLEGRLRLIQLNRCDITLISSGESHPGRAERQLAMWPALAAEIKILPTPMATQTAHFAALKDSALAQYIPAISRAILRHREALKELFAAGGDS